MKRSRVWIGDWLRAWAHRDLGAEDGGAALAHALGLSLERAPRPTTQPSAPAAVFSASVAAEPMAASELQAALPLDEAAVPRSSTMDTRAFEVKVERLSRREAPGLPLPSPPALPPPVDRLPEHEVEPLFSRASERALLGAVVATWRQQGPIAVEYVIEELARGRPLDQLPCRLVPAVHAGAVLLIERAMAEPFAADVIALRRQLRRVVGQSMLVEWWLGERAALQPRGAHASAWPPPRTMPVLAVVSHPGVLAPRVAELRERECPLIAIAPGRGARSLEHNITVIGWDHRTTVAAVSRARRRADCR